MRKHMNGAKFCLQQFGTFCTRAYRHAFMHTRIHAYIHTYMHPYIHTWMMRSTGSSSDFVISS